jgi:hypothetical protein
LSVPRLKYSLLCCFFRDCSVQRISILSLMRRYPHVLKGRFQWWETSVYWRCQPSSEVYSLTACYIIFH